MPRVTPLWAHGCAPLRGHLKEMEAYRCTAVRPNKSTFWKAKVNSQDGNRNWTSTNNRGNEGSEIKPIAGWWHLKDFLSSGIS